MKGIIGCDAPKDIIPAMDAVPDLMVKDNFNSTGTFQILLFYFHF